MPWAERSFFAAPKVGLRRWRSSGYQLRKPRNGTLRVGAMCLASKKNGWAESKWGGWVDGWWFWLNGFTLPNEEYTNWLIVSFGWVGCFFFYCLAQLTTILTIIIVIHASHWRGLFFQKIFYLPFLQRPRSVKSPPNSTTCRVAARPRPHEFWCALWPEGSRAGGLHGWLKVFI